MRGWSILLTLALLALANFLPKWLERKGALPAEQIQSGRASRPLPIERSRAASQPYVQPIRV